MSKKTKYNKHLLESERMQEINDFLEDKYNKLAEVYESLADGETEISQYEITIKQKQWEEQKK